MAVNTEPSLSTSKVLNGWCVQAEVALNGLVVFVLLGRCRVRPRKPIELDHRAFDLVELRVNFQRVLSQANRSIHAPRIRV